MGRREITGQTKIHTKFWLEILLKKRALVIPRRGYKTTITIDVRMK
jgi:hypothetical protein